MLVFIGVLGCMAISATVGTTTLLVAGAIDGRDYVATWAVWWTGDAMGVLIVAPFLWSLRRPRFDKVRWDRVAEAAALFAALAIACLIAVRNQEQLLFLVLPLLAWIAWRFQQRGAAPAALLVSIVVIAAAADDMGPFAGESLLSQMILLQTFNASVAFTTLLFAAAVSERQRLVEREQGAQRELYQREHRVATTLQRSLLPEHLPETIGLAVASRYLPATTDVAIGGDWYDIIALGDGRLGLVIGDVAGHGVNAAATMGQIRMALRAYAVDDLSPAAALGRLNRLMRELQPGTMATVLYAHLDPATPRSPLRERGPPPSAADHRPAQRGGFSKTGVRRRSASRRTSPSPSRRCGSNRVRRSFFTPTVWSSGGVSRSTSVSGCCNAPPGSRRTTSKQPATTWSGRSSTRVRPTTSRSWRCGCCRWPARRSG